MKKKNLTVAILATSFVGFAAATASAQNPTYTPNTGEIILGFQGINGLGGNNIVQVNLGRADIYRDATTNILNIINLNTVLNATFVPASGNWYDSQNLFMGLSATWSNINPPATLFNGDPDQTLYVSKPRTAVGANELIKNSTLNTPTGGQLTNGAGQHIGMGNTMESQGTALINVFDKALPNTWEEYNVTANTGVQSTAMGFATGGIQFRFASNPYGTFSDPLIGEVEGALDFYRIQATASIPGQFDEGATYGRAPQFQGIFTIDQQGDVSFITNIPEPSSALLLGLSSIVGVALRRHRKGVAKS